MTSVVIASYSYDDGPTLSVTVQVDDSYPDALAQARSEAVRGLVAMLDDDEAEYAFDEDDD